MTQFGVRGGRGAEQQCRKRGGSSKDGGVTPLKVKQLYSHINTGRFSLKYRYVTLQILPPRWCVVAACLMLKCHFVEATTNALFCSASEWPLFFTLFSFFPPLILNTGTRLGQRVSVIWLNVSLQGLFLCVITRYHRLFSCGCPLPDCAPLPGDELSSPGRIGSNSRSARAYTQLALLELKLSLWL